jgi:hypothetical protein
VNQSPKHFNTTGANNASRIEKSVSQPSSVASKPNHKLIAVNTADQRRNRTPLTGITRADEFTFLQTLVQRNEEVQNAFTPTIVDDSFVDAPAKGNRSAADYHTGIDPLSVESVVNLYHKRRKKLTWQGYFTPTVSYRTLNDGTIRDLGIDHKPAFGFQLGTTAKYAVTKNTKLRAGLQLNVNRYEIKTMESYTQLATIRLVDRGAVDYVTTTTNYNNFSGYQTNWLQNMYVQISAPIGVEVKLSGNDKVQFGMASTLQPTYLLGDKAYLISNDYKNYVEMPGLVRRWNLNTSLETYVGYSTGHINWQVGPQVRYQLLSSYLKKYPVKENLFDFGLRVGMSFNKF